MVGERRAILAAVICRNGLPETFALGYDSALISLIVRLPNVAVPSLA